MDHVFEGRLIAEIQKAFLRKLGYCPTNEVQSWNSSLTYMRMILETKNIPDECGVAIEFMIPLTQKRIDFILTGQDSEDRDSAVVVELKQWNKVEAVHGTDSLVNTWVGGKMQDRPHPSYQAWSYTQTIENFNEEVSSGRVSLHPCAFLHNYVRAETNDPLFSEQYSDDIAAAPPFCAGDAKSLRSFIARYISKPDSKEVLFRIENGRIKPSKSLQDSLKSMLEGNQEFVLLDDQKVAFERIKQAINEARKTGNKKVIVVEGGPGTGKSVVAINLLVDMINQDCVAAYVSKNSAPRDVYKALLAKDHRKARLDSLFKGSGQFTNPEKEQFDVLITDEAHRLNEKSGLYSNLGENQILEIIQSSKVAVFFLDELQRVTVADIGTQKAIKEFALSEGAEFSTMQLSSQFRCNGSDGYLTWLRNILEISAEDSIDGENFDYDFQVFDTPEEMHSAIAEKSAARNKSRVVAGYCWKWSSDSKSNPDSNDIVIGDYERSWNLGNTKTWAIDEGSIEQVGCIHTCQGLEFDYVGVIIGDDMRYEDGKVVTDFRTHPGQDKALRGIRKLPEDKAQQIADGIIRNTYHVLMTRGQKGCYVYCQDESLRNYIRDNLAKAPVSYGTFKSEDYYRAAEGKTDYDLES